ncbi:hypothetical protein HDU76_001770 [Blyttiomyces sp. JEL0837]|nr:hypothetical protein HDU76_001770 [Blyttiomyces sp. JEL0837]
MITLFNTIPKTILSLTVSIIVHLILSSTSISSITSITTSSTSITLLQVSAAPAPVVEARLTRRGEDIEAGLPTDQVFKGSASYYGDGTALDGTDDPPPIPPYGIGACGYNFIPKNHEYFAALAQYTFDKYHIEDDDGFKPNAVCGQCIKVEANGNSVVVPIVDSCPGCAKRGPYALDLSHQAIADLSGGEMSEPPLSLSPGVFGFELCLFFYFTPHLDPTLTQPDMDTTKHDSTGINQSHTNQHLHIPIMTFNIRYGTAKDGLNHWDLRKSLLVRVINKHSPAILCLQEALDFQTEYIITNTTLPYRKYGVGREWNLQGESCHILIVDVEKMGMWEQGVAPFKLDVFESGTFWLSDEPDRPGSTSYGNQLPRICSWVKGNVVVYGCGHDEKDSNKMVKEPQSIPLFLLNTHLDHMSVDARVKGVEQILAYVKTHMPSTNQQQQQQPLLVVTGDFNNASLQAWEVRHMLEDGFINLLDTPIGSISNIASTTPPATQTVDNGDVISREVNAKKSEATFHNFTGKAYGPQIDFVWLKREAVVNGGGGTGGGFVRVVCADAVVVKDCEKEWCNARFIVDEGVKEARIAIFQFALEHLYLKKSVED